MVPFLSIFCHCSMQKISILRGWEIGRTIFNFSCKTPGFCGAGCSFWYLFWHFFVTFLKCAPNSGGPASAAVRVLTAVNADSLCTLAGGWRSHDNSSLFQSSHASARSARARTSRVAKAVFEKPVHASRRVSSLFRSSLPTSYSAGCESE